MSWLRQFVDEEDGQDLIEYGLLAAFISLAVITAVTQIGTALDGAYDSYATEIEGFSS